ncbi:MAG: hypothetical protein ACRERD_00920 [Candidatus Binatia bacterium]
MAQKANHSSELPSYTDLSASWRHDMRKVVATYLDTSERLAKGTLGFYEKSTAWASNTPWAPLFKMQTDIANQFIDNSVNLARQLWQIEEKAVQKVEEAMKSMPKDQ